MAADGYLINDSRSFDLVLVIEVRAGFGGVQESEGSSRRTMERFRMEQSDHLSNQIVRRRNTKNDKAFEMSIGVLVCCQAVCRIVGAI